MGLNGAVTVTGATDKDLCASGSPYSMGSAGGEWENGTGKGGKSRKGL